MTDPRISQAIASDPQGRLNNPNILQEDDPPMLRFERGVLEDRQQTLESGMFSFKDAVFVHVRAFGDVKNEVPYVVETTVKVPSYTDVVVEKTVPVTIIREDADGNRTEDTKFETKEVLEQEATWTDEVRTPWLDQLKERHRNGRITTRYYESCVKAFEKWKETGDVPVDGFPVVEWKMISPAQQQTLLAVGINSVEKAAEMSEDAMDAYGMGAREVKKKAAEWLLSGKDQNRAAAKLIALETQLDQRNEEMTRLQEKFAELEAKMAQKGEESSEVTDDNSLDSTEDDEERRTGRSFFGRRK